jgi:hypothetical protein
MSSDPEWKSLPIPEINSRWDRPHLGYGGSSFRTVRVMGIVEGYVVARLSGASPFLVRLSDFHRTYSPKIMPKRQRKGIEKPR